ncbi:sulfurtransferase [Phaeodactylibacter luteus]|uniref:Sulfurtransferase n=1 Tax=Phaeodactylibacter luteus TaxID=1564516 RepID=A0A5C6RLZ2_9BACT|nr:sulfurtransferase [Phaeodactylibacter luteus]TXB63273.1 sulfurtransferase [Phaeodactylibacter luteus]
MNVLTLTKKWAWAGLSLALFFTACQTEAPGAEKPETSPETTAAPVDESLKASVKGPHLLEPAEVKALYDSGEPFKVIEISKADKYEKGHLPGAINFWRPDYEGGGYEYSGMRLSADEMAALLGSHGISPDDFILVYCTKGSVDAIRFMWMLDLYGHSKKAIMNGGKAAWAADGYELTTEAAPEAAPVLYTFQQPEQTAKLASFDDMVAALQDTNVIILDTREPEEYQGVPYVDKGACYPYKKGAFTFGRIPGAKHLNWSDAVDLDGDHRFKSLKDLKYNFKKAGITPDKKIIAYCQSGVRSAHTTYVLTELLGYPDVRNYDGSWIEWSHRYVNQGDVPVEREIDEAEHQIRLAALQAEAAAKLAAEE